MHCHPERFFCAKDLPEYFSLDLPLRGSLAISTAWAKRDFIPFTSWLAAPAFSISEFTSDLEHRVRNPRWADLSKSWGGEFLVRGQSMKETDEARASRIKLQLDSSSPKSHADGD